MASALQHVAWEPCLLETRPDRALESYARRKQGIPNPSIPYFVSVPWLARAVIDLHPEYGLLVHLDQNVADLVALVVSQENSCRFCYAGVRALLWGQGMSKVRIQRVEQDLMRADLPPRTVAAIAFGRSQSRSGPPGAREAREALRRAGFSDDEMKEIAYAVANTDFSNRAHTILAIPSLALERLPDRLHMRLFRPLIKRILQSHHSRGRATALDSVPSYPYARLVKAYAGSPDRAGAGTDARGDVGLPTSHATMQALDPRHRRPGAATLRSAAASVPGFTPSATSRCTTPAGASREHT